jgi:hypothetical protein
VIAQRATAHAAKITSARGDAMTDIAPDGTPTYFANIVTSNLFPDELVFEFRRFIQEHRKVAKPNAPDITAVSPPTSEEVFATTPLARVVLTFTAAKELRDYLNKTIPQMEKVRREQ